MDINGFIQLIQSIPGSIGRQELMSSIQGIEKDFFSTLKERNTKPWERGKGLSISQDLCRFKDTVIQKVLHSIDGVPKGITIIAVGGFGRGELSPYSDIDLLILHQENAPVQEFAQKFLYILWDMNYHLGCSTRTISNVKEHVVKDETFLTAIFESRFIAGDEKLFTQLSLVLKKYMAKNRIGYLKSKIDEIYAIIQNTGNEVLLKEPNLKNNAGGLRSVHLMEWLNFAFYSLPGLNGLRNLLPSIYFKKVSTAYDFILYLRNMLHFVNGRKEDNLYMDYHLDVAGKLALPGDDYHKIRRLMKHYYDKAMDIYLILLYAVEELTVRFLKKNQQRLGRKNKDNFFVSNKQFFIREKAEPSVLGALNAVLECTRGNYRFTYSLIQYLNQSSFLLTDQQRFDKPVFQLFREILELDHSYSALNVLRISGFLYRFIPVIARIKHMIVYNPFHKYTVDQHSLEAVSAFEALYTMHDLTVEKSKYYSFIEAAEKYQADKWLLKLCLLLHDTGKAFPGDHAKNGVELVTAYLEKVPIYSSYKQAVLFLIKNHLLLSNLVRRSDIDSMAVLLDLSKELFLTPYPAEYLDFLYLVTYSDISATNPKNFSGYIGGLLNQVYKKATGLLHQKIDADYHKNLFQNTLESLKKNAGEEGIEEFVIALGEKYVLTNDEDEVMDDYRTLKNLKEIRYKIDLKLYNDYFKVKFFAYDRLGLFAMLSGILLLSGADIVRANIHTYRDIAVDEFYITRLFGTELQEKSMKEQVKAWKEDLDRLYSEFQDRTDKLDDRIGNFKQRIKLVNQVFNRQTDIAVHSTGERDYRIEVSCTDRPALLYDITHLFAQNGIEIKNAIIDTAGWYVRDSFDVKASENIDWGWIKSMIEGTIESQQV